MKNLAQKVFNALKYTKNLDEVQKDIEKYQSNLMKNLNSSLLDNDEKNKLLKVYMDLQDVGKSLYRYGVLKKNNHLSAADEEKEKIEHKVLKGYICNVKYVWKSEHGENTCDECESMDGEEFESDEDIPPKPHPNCKCEVVIVDDDEEQKDDKESDKENYQRWIMPCKGNISSPYGWRVHPIHKTKKWHNGIDIAAPMGTIVVAPADGIVTQAGYENNLNGNTVRLDHGDVAGIRVLSVYIHLQVCTVKKGQSVKMGEIIGRVGSTGSSTGPHLHFSVYEEVRGNDVDPLKYIEP